jgi:nitrogen fixation protein NifB
MKIAITSSNGTTVDKHFGEASVFYIYDIKPKKMKFIEKRESLGYSINQLNHDFDKDRLDLVYENIQDCQTLYTARIGLTPAEKLKAKGLNIKIFNGKINDIQ